MRNTRVSNIGNERGVALLIVLLVTALLIALVFEFAYGTRVSLRAAVNFRDSQRAYFLARSGVNFAGALLADNLKNGKPQDNLEQRDWQVVPLMAAGDTELRVRWEDESGKINISKVMNTQNFNQLVSLFTTRGVDQEVLNRIREWMIEQQRSSFYLLTEFHQFMSDEEFRKIQDVVTVAPVMVVNINTASADVLGSIGVDAATVSTIVAKRNNDPYTSTSGITATGGSIDVTSNIFKVDSHATVGGYTKQVQAVITRTSSGFTISYWRAL